MCITPKFRTPSKQAFIKSHKFKYQQSNYLRVVGTGNECVITCVMVRDSKRVHPGLLIN